MAVKKLLLCLGQSNGEPVGDRNEWLILHPGAFLEAAPNNPTGSYNDDFTMPGSFPGFTTLNLMGRASKESRYLTFYNPYVTGYRRYPGVGIVTSGSTTTVVNTEQSWVTPLVNAFTVTRTKTGEVRTVTATGANSFTVGVAFASAPAADEQFTYTFVSTSADAASTTVITLNVKWPTVAGNPPSLLGVVIKGLTGANAGVERTILSVDGTTGAVTISAAWAAHASGDTFEMKPQGLTSAEWHKWAYFLPWCPFEGSILAGKENPYPPGFNYPNGISSMRTFNPGPAGVGICGQAAVWHHGAGLQIAQLNSDDLRVVSLAVGGASLSYNEFAFDVAIATGWLDPKQQCTFNPSSSNALYNRLLDIMDVAVVQAAAEGNTLEIELCVMLQGEADAGNIDSAESYEDNLRAFVAVVRQAIVTRGWWTGNPAHIKWIHPKITTDNWVYAAQVRDGIQRIADSNRFFRTFEVNGIAKGDIAHYSGVGQTEIENLVVDQLTEMRKEDALSIEVDICNTALSHVGNKAKVTALNSSSDPSFEASLCSRYYPISLKAVLAMHAWGFAMMKADLVLVNQDDDGLATTNDDLAWLYRYELPLLLIKPVAVVHKEVSGDFTVAGVKSPVDFTIKRSTADRAIRLYTNQESAALRYVMFEEDSGKFDPLFVLAHTWHLASLLAGPLVKGDQGAAEAQRCLQRMGMYLAEARGVDSSARQVTMARKAAWIAGR